MEAMQARIPAPSASVARRSRAAVAGLAVAIALSGGFAVGRITAPAVDGARSQTVVDLGRVSAGSAAAPRGFDVTYRPRHHRGDAGQGWTAGVPTTSGLMRPVPRHHQSG